MDHCPLLLSRSQLHIIAKAQSRFQSMWLQIPHFLNLIRGFWSKLQFFGCPQFVLASKLRALKVMLKSWNRSQIGDVHFRVAGSRAILDVVQEEISSLGPAEDRFLREQYAHTRFLFDLSL